MQIGIIGYGDLGKQLRSFLQQQHADAVFTVFDDYTSSVEGATVAPFDAYQQAAYAAHQLYIGLGYKHLAKREVIATAISTKQLTPFIHPSVVQGADIQIGAGCFVYPGAIIDHQAVIGKGVLINNGVVVSHETNIGDATYVSPGVVICGKAQIGKRCFIGAGAIISNGVTIGDDVVIGIGSVITKNVPSGATVIGNPMRFTDKLNVL